MAATTRTTLTRTTQTMDFGMFDARGRAVGSYVRAETVLHEESTTGYGDTRAAGTYFTFYPGSMRDGLAFGASQQGYYFDSEAARDVAVIAHFAKAQKRAQRNKKFTATGGA